MQDRYRSPDSLYFLPIGGTAMAPLAGLLQELGHAVSGVDNQLYPPMSTLLEELAIPVRIGFDAGRVPTDVDRVVVGNAVPRSNPEVVEVLRRRVPFVSQAEAVAHYVLARGQHSLVVAGTHGKTTTASMLAWILEHSGRDPSYLIGGLPRWSRRPYRAGGGDEIVIEGDEYNTAFFDRGPKFLHYRPHVFLLGPVEFDHADIYADVAAVVRAFAAGVAQVPRHGAVVVNRWAATTAEVVAGAAAPVVAVGPDRGCALRLLDWSAIPDGCSAGLEWHGSRLELELPLAGEHNLHNAAMALAAALHLGVPSGDAVAALAEFAGVVRRLEVLGEAAGVTVVDDFAHHPTALAATLAAGRQRWPGRRLVVAFEPRSLTAARRSFADLYLAALAAADLVLVTEPHHRSRLPADEVLDRRALAAGLSRRGVTAIMPDAGADVVALLEPLLEAGDVVIACSSGSFDGLHRRLLAALADR